MRWFRCLIRVEGLPGRVIGHTSPVGFFVNRFVEAETTDAATAIVRELLHTESKLAKYCHSILPATVTIEELVEVTSADIPREPQGFVWYSMG
jgi:hypothetical protein